MGSNRWWERSDLGYRDGRLYLGRQDLLELARSGGTPTFVYSGPRVRENLERLRAALDRHGLRHRILYAVKANRFLPLVTYLKVHGHCGIDACSPGELRLARQAGFAEEAISFTGTSVSDADLDVLVRHPGVHVNCDSLSALRRLGERCRGRSVGVRINPELGAGYHEGLRYAGERPTKFGIYRERFEEALELAQTCALRIETLHFHVGCGYRSADLDILDAVLERCAWFLDRCPGIRVLNIGGGLGLALDEGHAALDLQRWSAIIAKHLHERDLELQVEPGDYLVKDAGVLLLQVNSVEEKGGTRFAGVDGGLNLQNLPAYYRVPLAVAPLVWKDGGERETVTVAGNINEAIDLFAEDVSLPPLAEGDFLALLNAGGYGAACSSNHCMRGAYSEYFLAD